MSGNSNPSTNSPQSSRYASPTITYVNNNITGGFTAQLLEEFNACQEQHILVSSTVLAQYVPSSPTPSVQEVAPPAPLHICIHKLAISPDPNIPHLPILPGMAETILYMD